MKKKRYIIPIFIPNFACNFRCIFCDQSKFTTKNFGCITEINFSYEIEKYLSYYKDIDYKNIELAFFGGTFTSLSLNDQKYIFNSVSKYFLEKKISSIRISTRPDKISQENLKLLKENYVKIIELGVQSIYRDVLLKNNRPVFYDKIKEASKLIKDYGFVLGHQYMPGLYSSNEFKDISTVLKAVLDCKPDIMRVYPTLVVKNTKLEDLYNIGKYIPLTVNKAVKRVLKIYIIAKYHNINIIRIGIYNDPEMDKDSVIAGPFIDNFADLVYSRLYRYIITDFLLKSKMKNDIKIKVLVNEKNLSSLNGYKKENKIKLNRFYKDIEFKIDNELKLDDIIIEYENNKILININEFIKKEYEKIKQYYFINEV